MPYPTGSEGSTALPYIGQFFDKGAAVYNVMHPDFGAVGDGVNDDGAAIKDAITAVGEAGGGVVLIPPGTYDLATIVIYGTAKDVILWVLPGATFTTGSLPSDDPTDGNYTIDWSPVPSGAYTPTITIVDNADSVTHTKSQYLRVGNVATVSGRAEVDPTSSLVAVVFRVSLPFATEFQDPGQCGGGGGGIVGNVVVPLVVSGDTANEEARVSFDPENTNTHFLNWNFTYLIQ